MSNEATLIISFGFGIMASFFAWLFVAKGSRLKIIISKEVLFIPSTYNDGDVIPKIKVENLSRYKAFEFNLKGRMFLFGLVKEYPDMPTLFVITVGNGSHPYLPCKKEGLKDKTSGRLFRLHMNKTSRKNLAQYITDLKQGQEPTVVDFLNLDSRNYIEVSVICSHGFSFTRGICTQKYYSNDIKSGYFDDHGVTVRSSPSREYIPQENDIEPEDTQE